MRERREKVRGCVEGRKERVTSFARERRSEGNREGRGGGREREIRKLGRAPSLEAEGRARQRERRRRAPSPATSPCLRRAASTVSCSTSSCGFALDQRQRREGRSGRSARRSGSWSCGTWSVTRRRGEGAFERTSCVTEPVAPSLAISPRPQRRSDPGLREPKIRRHSRRRASRVDERRHESVRGRHQ